MSNKKERISMRIESDVKAAFWEVCNLRQQTPSKVIKHLMEQYVQKAQDTIKELNKE